MVSNWEKQWVNGLEYATTKVLTWTAKLLYRCLISFKLPRTFFAQ